ncbi:MAG: TonB-dependent receptor [Gammaproteobacteria bacterium]|nr:TonB-dependent receptor [Gammaproteobacteria bacterium]
MGFERPIPCSIVTNQGQGEVKGLELELLYLLTDDITLGANYALADTEFTEGCDEFQYILTSGGGLLNPNAATPCTGNDLTGNANGSIDGNAFPLAAKNMFSAFADFRRPILEDLEFFANADVSWEDEKPVQVHNLAWVPDATIVNARIGIDTGRMSLAFYGRNLTDEDAPTMVTRWIQDPVASGAAGGGAGSTPFQLGCNPFPPTCSTSYPRAFFGDLRRGRNFGVEVNYRFGGSD